MKIRHGGVRIHLKPWRDGFRLGPSWCSNQPSAVSLTFQIASNCGEEVAESVQVMLPAYEARSLAKRLLEYADRADAAVQKGGEAWLPLKLK